MGNSNDISMCNQDKSIEGNLNVYICGDINNIKIIKFLKIFLLPKMHPTMDILS
jgi:hypothetical protein